MEMGNKLKKLRILTSCLYLFAFFWLVFAVVWFLRSSPYRYFYSIAGAGYASTLFLLTYFIGKRRLWAWWAATFVVGLGVIVSIFDQIGWIDIAYIIFSLVVFITLLKGHSLVTKSVNYGKN